MSPNFAFGPPRAQTVKKHMMSTVRSTAPMFDAITVDDQDVLRFTWTQIHGGE